MLIAVKNIKGEVIDQIEVRESVFGVPFNMAVVHQALQRQLANSRLGTAATKTRGEVEGSGRKVYMQKHTGRARQGSIRAPHRRGGGVVFGPHPRSYHQAMPKKMRRLALKCVLSAKLRDGEMVVVDDIAPSQPKTKEMKQSLHNLGGNSSALVVTAQAEPQVVIAAANLPGVKTLPAPLLNVSDLLSHRIVVMTVAAVRKAEEIWAGN